MKNSILCTEWTITRQLSLFYWTHFTDEKTNRPSGIIDLIKGRSYIHNLIRNTKELTHKQNHENNNNKTREIHSRELSAFKKHTTVLPSKDGTLNLREKKESTDLKLYVFYLGRTGNNLLQYVSGLGIAHHNNRSLFFNPKMIKLKKIFPKLEMNFLNESPKWPILTERYEKSFDPIFFNLSKKNLRIGYAFHSFKYFQDIFEDIYNRTLSRFDENLLSKATKFIQEAKHNYKQLNKIVSKETKIISVCIHVRRDDFLSYHSRKVGFLVPSSLDIQNAMNYFQNKFKYIVFIVASDGLNWCKMQLNRSNVYFSTMTSPNEDFVLMCSCDHMIMTVGTFGFWGAWFTSWRGGIAMYYERVFSEDFNNVKSLSRHDWYPPNWLAYTNRSVIESRYLGDKLTTNLNPWAGLSSTFFTGYLTLME